MLGSETEKIMLRHTRNPLVNELIPTTEFWDAERTVQEVKTLYKRVADQSPTEYLNSANSPTAKSVIEEDECGCMPELLLELVRRGRDGSLALSALGGTLYYLRQAFLDETLLRFAKFELLPCSGFSNVVQKPYMVLDAAALENLEIFENNRNGDSSGLVDHLLLYS